MNTNRLNFRRVGLMALLSTLLSDGADMDARIAQAAVAQPGAVTVLNAPSTAAQVGGGIDFVNARPMQLPGVPSRSDAAAQADLINALTSQRFAGPSGHVAGKRGDGTENPMQLGAPRRSATDDNDVTPQEFGTFNHPFSTARADLSPTATNKVYPYRASGKLFFNIGDSTYVCSASLIKKGVVVTAAHCVAHFGHSQFYTNWQFVPGYRNGKAPYGVWTVQTAVVMTSYFDGTDPCAVAGIVCQNDVAVLLLNASADAYPGTSTGWYGYGWDGYGFTGSGLTQLSQIGYPVCLNKGAYMARNDSYGYTSAANSSNTLIGSLMCGGSSGGPWLVNLGIRPVLTGTTEGMAPASNIVVGVTSWGYSSTAPKEQGASPFSSGNILPLVNTVCPIAPAACS